MRRGSIYVNAPSFLVVTLAGAVATILATAMIYGAPAAGLPVLDLPSLIGGVVVSDPVVAFWIGYAVFFVGGWLLAPSALMELWRELPGDDVRFRGAALKGALFGGGLWIGSGVLTGLLSAVSSFPVGFFGAAVGASGVAMLLAGHLAYGVALALACDMAQGLSPLDSIGWLGHGAGHSA